MRGKAEIKRPAACESGITPAYAGKRCRLPVLIPLRWDHPRVCGEKSKGVAVGWRDVGSPPRMRGKGQHEPCPVWRRGITPAYAGKSVNTVETTQLVWDHPRVCGEKNECHYSLDEGLGSPPRMRGKVLRARGYYA